jgi:hypothetical protein
MSTPVNYQARQVVGNTAVAGLSAASLAFPAVAPVASLAGLLATMDKANHEQLSATDKAGAVVSLVPAASIAKALDASDSVAMINANVALLGATTGIAAAAEAMDGGSEMPSGEEPNEQLNSRTYDYKEHDGQWE